MRPIRLTFMPELVIVMRFKAYCEYSQRGEPAEEDFIMRIASNDFYRISTCSEHIRA
jgi:hypothetical protein